MIDEGPHVHEATIQFSTEDKWVDISDVQVELTDIIGVAAWRERGPASTTRRSQSSSSTRPSSTTCPRTRTERVMSTCLSLSTLANQRVAIFKERAAVREDYYVAHLDNGDEVPVEKWSEFYEDRLESEMTTDHSEEAHAKAKAEANQGGARQGQGRGQEGALQGQGRGQGGPRQGQGRCQGGARQGRGRGGVGVGRVLDSGC